MASVRIMVSYDGEWVKSPETGIFRFDGSKAKGMLVPKNITYQGLLNRVYSLLDVDRNEFGIAMKFLYASSVPVAPADIVSDDDTNFFIGENSGKASLRTPLCVSLVRKDLQAQQIGGEESGQTFDAAPEVREETVGPATITLAGIEENEDVEGVGTSSAKLATERVLAETEVGTGCPQGSGDFAALAEPITSVAPAADPRSSLPSSPCMPIEWVTTKEALSTSFNSSAVSHSDELEVRQVFSSKKALQEKLSMLAIKKKFEFKVHKSSPDVLVVACVDEKCQWRLRACRFRDNTSFQVRKFVNGHSCSTESRFNEHRQASSWVIGQLIKSKDQGTSRSYKPKDIIDDVQRELGVTLSYEKAWRAREIALNSDGAPHRRRLTGLSSGKHKRHRTPLAKEDRRIRRCKKCGEVGHYSKTCSIPIIILPPSDNISGAIVREEDRAMQVDKVAEN